jgi:hypothetical protein
VIRRLFDEYRDPEARVEPTDWHPTPDTPFALLDTHDTVAKRRRWYLELLDRGML